MSSSGGAWRTNARAVSNTRGEAAYSELGEVAAEDMVGIDGTATGCGRDHRNPVPGIAVPLSRLTNIGGKAGRDTGARGAGI